MSHNDTTAILLALLLRRRNNENKTKRRWWVRPINRNREKKGEFRRVQMEMRLHDVEWYFSYTRMTPTVFNNLLNLVGPSLVKHSIRKALSPSQRLVITLRFLATGDSYFSIANSYHIGKSTVCAIIQEVLPILWNILNPIVLPEPDEAKLKQIADDYWKIWNMPQCMGSIDGKHIRVTAPAKTGSLYYNYKGYFSIILMAICDADYNFTYVDIGAYGSTSDGGVFADSKIGQLMRDRLLPTPPPSFLPNTNNMFGHFFVGDAAFPLSDTLMRPYSGKNLDIVKSVFNYRLSRARRVIENTFGVLVARWRIYHRAICASPENVDNIIKATVCLHNFVRCSLPAREHYCPPNYVDKEDVLGKWRQEVEGCVLMPCGRLGSNNATFQASQRRNELAKYFLTPAGFKEGQIEYVKRT